MEPKYRFQWYQRIHDRLPIILEQARRAAGELGLERLRGKVGLYPGSSSCPGTLTPYVLRAIEQANQVPVFPMRRAMDELREVVKDIFGDGYDAAVANTCEAGLRVVYETLFAPPTLRKGDAYRARYITPYGEDYEFISSYGRPFPPRYKNLFVDRSASAGELGVEGKSLTNLDCVFVRLVGARYEPHGVKFNPVPLLSRIDHGRSFERISQVAARHADCLAGFSAVGYDTPGYGANEQDEKGVPKLLGRIRSLADEYDVPYVVDAAAAAPVFLPSIKEWGAHIMLWSTDKAIRAPISGLIVGEEELMVPVRKALGFGGDRSGNVSSHGKALFSLSDPGRDSVVGLTAVLRLLRDDPEKIRRPIDRMHQIVVEEFGNFQPSRFRKDLLITKSYAFGGIEVNYERSWTGQAFGIPIFNMEDMFANTNPIMSALDEMGIYPATIYSGNIIMAPGLGNLDGESELMEEPTRLAVRALVRAMEIVCKQAGLSD